MNLIQQGKTVESGLVPTLYLVPSGSYEANWVHTPEAEQQYNLLQYELFSTTSITVSTTETLYYGNTYCQLTQDGNNVSFSLQIDIDTTYEGPLQTLLGTVGSASEFRISLPKLFPKAQDASPIFNCNVVAISNGKSLNSNTDFIYIGGRLLCDGTLALIRSITNPFIAQPKSFINGFEGGDLGLMLAENGFFSNFNPNGVSICIEGSYISG